MKNEEQKNELDWLDELPELETLLEGDSLFIYKTVGLDVFKVMFSRLDSIPLYISKRKLSAAREHFIRKKYDGTNKKYLAKRLGVPVRTVEMVVAKTPRGLNDTIGLFEEKK